MSSPAVTGLPVTGAWRPDQVQPAAPLPGEVPPGPRVEVLRHARHYAQAIGGRRRNDGLIAALRLLDDALAEAGDRAGAAVGAPLAR